MHIRGTTLKYPKNVHVPFNDRNTHFEFIGNFWRPLEIIDVIEAIEGQLRLLEVKNLNCTFIRYLRVVMILLLMKSET